MIGINPKSDSSLFFETLVMVFLRESYKNYWNSKKSGFYNGYKPTNFYLAVTGSNSSYENIVCEIASNKQVETCEFHSMNQENATDLTKRYNKSPVTLYCRQRDPYFAC